VLSKLEKAVRPLTRGINTVGTAGLFLMMFMVTTDVFLRDAFRSPIKGTIEISELFQVLVVFLGLAYCESKRGHVRVDFIVSYLGRRPRTILEAITTLVTLVFFAFMTWYSATNAIQAFESKELFEMLRIVVWPFRFIVPLGTFVFCLELLLHLLSDINAIRQKATS
jgi:TRAP-type C4-dicarboxylate transport system permease small subunit